MRAPFDLASGGDTEEFTFFVGGDGYLNLVAASPEGLVDLAPSDRPLAM